MYVPLTGLLVMFLVVLGSLSRDLCVYLFIFVVCHINYVHGMRTDINFNFTGSSVSDAKSSRCFACILGKVLQCSSSN